MKKAIDEPKRTNRTNVKQLTSTELMIAYQGGNTAAFEELYRRFKPRMNQWMKPKVWDAHDREDIIHNAFLCLVRFANKYQPDFKFSTWFYAVVKNQMIEFFRSKKSALSINRYDDNPDHRTIEIEDTRSLDRLLESKEATELVRRYIETSGSSFAQIVGLRDLEGFTYQEIEAITGLPSGTVRSRLHRGRKEIQNLLS